MNPLLLIPLIAGLAKGGYGLAQLIGGNKGLKNLDRPTYNVNDNIQYNQQLAAQLASQGIPQSAQNIYAENIERGLGSTIGATLQGGGGLGAINNAFSTSTDAFRNLMAADAMQKLQNQQILMSANKDLADEELRAWDYNVNLPYQTEFAKYTQQTNSGALNLFGGLSDIGSAAMFGSLGGMGGGTQGKTGSSGAMGGYAGGAMGGMNMGAGGIGQQQGGFGTYNQPANNLGLGQYNWLYGLPNFGFGF